VEYAITCHWSVKLEYNHLFLGTEDIHGTTIDDGVPEPESYRVDLDQNSVQVGLDYKF
jgi:opacity protein-like surface antigen